MCENEVMARIVEALNVIGLFYEAEDLKEMSLKELLEDSLMFISFVIELENLCDIEIPDEYLIIDNMPDIPAVVRTIQVLLQEKE